MSSPDILKRILPYIPENARVLDLGCGSGDLLDELRSTRNIHGYGVDIDVKNILACTQKGISAFHGDIDEGLTEFSDQAFDIVILSQTLQQVRNPSLVLQEMKRVGRSGIVVFPNFGHWSIRLYLLFNGKAPMSKTLPYSWSNTPNIRVLSIRDFREFCQNLGFHIHAELHGSTWFSRLLPNCFANLFARNGLLIIGDSSNSR